MTNKHTPSPWRIEPTKFGSCDYRIYDGKDNAVAYTTQEDKLIEYSSLPNARLIAAAPDMLREMESLAQAFEDVHDIPQSFYDAINKAKGN